MSVSTAAGVGDPLNFAVAPITGLPAGLSNTINDSGGVVGGTLGANYQANWFVVGVEGDGTIPESIRAPPPPSVLLAVIARLATIGWLLCADVQVTRGIASYSMARLAARSPICKRASTGSLPPTPKQAGPLGSASSGPLPIIGRLSSKTFTLISATGT